jgi:hypothetical protein
VACGNKFCKAFFLPFRVYPVYAVDEYRLPDGSQLVLLGIMRRCNVRPVSVLIDRAAQTKQRNPQSEAAELKKASNWVRLGLAASRIVKTGVKGRQTATKRRMKWDGSWTDMQLKRMPVLREPLSGPTSRIRNP